MTSTMDHHIEDQEEKMRILFDNDKEDLRGNGMNLERETELLIIEDLPSPIAMETSDFNGRSDETSSPDPDKSDKSRTSTSLGTSEDLTIPSSPLTEDCASPLMEDNVFPLMEDSLSCTSSPLEEEEEEVKPASEHVDGDSTDSHKEGEDSLSNSEMDSKDPELKGFSSSHSETDNIVKESHNSSNESPEITDCKEVDDKSSDIQTSCNEDTNSSCEMRTITADVTVILPPITEEVTANIPPITGEITENIPPNTEDVTANIPPIIDDVTANIPPIIDDVTVNIPPITEDVTADIPPIMEEVTSIPVNENEGTEEKLIQESSDNNYSESKDQDVAAVSLVIEETHVIVAEDPVAVDPIATSLSVETEDFNGKETSHNKLTIDTVPVDSDSVGSVQLPLTPVSQGSCDPPLTPSSMATDFNSREEVQALQTELQQTHNLVKQLQAVILKERVTHSHNVAVFKMRLQQKEQECRNNAARSDKQLGEVIAHLLLLEGQLKKEHTQVRYKMADNDKVIRKQEEDIESLKETNQRLLDAVREAYGRKGKNGVLLLENLGDDKNGSNESLDSPTSKSPPLKSPHKGRWGSMKDKMTRKHRSSLDLSDTDFDINQGLLVGRQYGSQESLLMIGRKSKEMREGRDKKSRSIAGYPDSSLVGLMEVPDENENRLDSFSHSKVLGGGFGNKNRCENGQSTNTLQVSMNGIDQSSAGLLSAISMPILSQTDKNSNPVPAKERPKSISSIEHISSRDSGGSPDLPPQMESYPPPPKSPGATSNSSFSDSSNPFKNLKTILKRKGSKIKGKKRSVTMADSPSQDYQAAVKKHFEKYDMS